MTENSRTRRGTVMNPLWIISLFLSFTEVTLGIAVTRTSGSIQVALTSFVISFPLVIAIAFFLILWNRPYVLYAPLDYGKATDVSRFVEAMNGARSRSGELYEEIQEVLKENLNSNRIIRDVLQSLEARPEPDTTQKAEKIVDQAVSKATERIREIGFLTIDATALAGRPLVWEEPHSGFRVMSDLLDTIWSRISDEIMLPSYTYGIKWIVRDAATGREYRKAGTTWAERNSRVKDDRPLEVLGIVPGMKLEAVWI